MKIQEFNLEEFEESDGRFSRIYLRDLSTGLIHNCYDFTMAVKDEASAWELMFSQKYNDPYYESIDYDDYGDDW